MDYDYVVSAHGPYTEPAIDTASVVVEQREYLEDLMAAVKKEIVAGTGSPDKLKISSSYPKMNTGTHMMSGCR